MLYNLYIMRVGNLPPQSHGLELKFPTLPGNMSKRRREVERCVGIVESGHRMADSVMTNIALCLGIGVRDSEVTNIALNALFTVNGPRADLKADDIADIVQQETGSGLAIDHVIDRLFKQNYLQTSGSPEQATVLGSPGLWLLEMLYMHDQDTVNPMVLAETSLREANFFVRIFGPDPAERFSALL